MKKIILLCFLSPRSIKALAAILIIFSASSKGSGFAKAGNYPDTAVTVLNKPVKINVYPVINKSNSNAKIYIETMGIGNKPIVLPMIFDTGSAGVSIYAEAVFPESIVDTTGFKFKNGKDTIQYMGITITKLNIQKTYGAAGKTVTRVTGNIGYASLTVGDSSGAVKMQRIPILFFYNKLANGKQRVNNINSIFGVDPAYGNAQQIANPVNLYREISPFKYLNYSGGLIAGYKLDKIILTGCNIRVPGDCTPKALLTIGLTAQDESLYTMNSLNRQRPLPIDGPDTQINPAYNEFDPAIPGCVINAGTANWEEKVLLDSGNPGVLLNLSQDVVNNAGSTIRLTTPSQASFSYDCKAVNYKTTFNPFNKRSIFGIYFFTNFDFLEDYQNGAIGLK